jgi:predicted RNA binding protein YcfA (HicA-like mRNA interferase family)
MTPKELIKILEHRGFILKRVKGSHHFFTHPLSGKIAVVPYHKRDLPKGTFHGILKQAGIEKDTL